MCPHPPFYEAQACLLANSLDGVGEALYVGQQSCASQRLQQLQTRS
jgi:hypothetical protein